MSRYMCPREVVIDNISEFKRYLIHLLENIPIKPVSITVNNPQANYSVEQVWHLVYNVIVTTYPSNKYFDYLGP